MELKKVWHNEKLEIHEGWYNQRLKFQVFRYADGTEKVIVWDYLQEKALLDVELPNG